MSNPGFWAVGVVCPKYDVNIGSLWRSAMIMGADMLVLVEPGNRGELHTKRMMDSVAGTRRDYALRGTPGLGQRSDVLGASRHMPVVCVGNVEDLRTTLPTARIVGVECPDVAERYNRVSVSIRAYSHFERALYLLGAEDFGLRPRDLAQCDDLVYIESALPASLNLACAGTVVCADRYAKVGSKRHTAAA